MAGINIDWRTFTSQGQWERYFKSQLPKNTTLLIRSIGIIYALQTASEQGRDAVVENNGVGFNRIDGNVMSKIAKKIERGVSLSDADLTQARTRMPKYWKQLMLHAKNKQTVKQETKQNELHDDDEIRYSKCEYNSDLITEYTVIN